MSTTRRVLLGILAIWPFLYFFLFMAFFMVSFFAMPWGSSEEGMPVAFLVIMPLHVLTMLVMFATIAIYLILAVKNKDLDDTMRIIWVILLAMFAVFAAPVYWWLYVRKGPDGPSSTGGEPVVG